jgi:hypothetical protein
MAVWMLVGMAPEEEVKDAGEEGNNKLSLRRHT